MAGQSKDCRPTGNRTGGGAYPTRDRGGSMIPLGTRGVHQHAHSHARSQLKTIMREQRPGGKGSRVPAKERRQKGASRRNRRSGERRGRPKPRSTREGDRSEITTFRDADRTGEDSQEIVQYQRAEPPGPLLHR